MKTTITTIAIMFTVGCAGNTDLFGPHAGGGGAGGGSASTTSGGGSTNEGGAGGEGGGEDPWGCGGCGEKLDDGSCAPIEGTCRVATGPCDAAEICNGKQLLCPEDLLRHHGEPPANMSCGWFACNGVQAGCPSSCSDDTDCVPWPGYTKGFCDSTGTCVGPDGSV